MMLPHGRLAKNGNPLSQSLGSFGTIREDPGPLNEPAAARGSPLATYFSTSKR